MSAGPGSALPGPGGTLGAPMTGRYLAFHLHPDVLVVCAGIGIGYWWAVTRLGPRLVPRGTAVVSRRQVLWFASGLGLLWIFAEWPIHDLAEHYSYAIHMVEHLVFTMACAPMMLLGLPGWLLRWMVAGRPWHGVVRFVCKPVSALVTNAGVLLLSHWPAVVNLTTHNEWFHFLMHTLLFSSAVVLFMPLINRIPELPRLSKPARILYLFPQSFAPIVPTLFLIFSTHVVYRAYLLGPGYLGWSATGDQEMAGSLMGTLQPLQLWLIMTYLFFSWWAEEQRRDRGELPEDLTWDDVERELATPRP